MLVLAALGVLLHFILTIVLYMISTIINPTLQMGKLRPREVKCFSQHHTAIGSQAGIQT